MGKYKIKRQSVYMGAGLTRSVWAVFHGDDRYEWFTNELEAQNKLNTLNRDEEVLTDD
jgi:hypothetical protein